MYMLYARQKFKKILLTILVLFEVISLCACSSHAVKLQDNIDKLNDSAKEYFSMVESSNYGEHFQIKAEVEKSQKTESTSKENRIVYTYEYVLYILPIYEESVRLKGIEVTIDDDNLSKLFKNNGIMLPSFNLPYFELAKRESKLEDYTCQTVSFTISIYEDLLSNYDLTIEEVDDILSSINVTLKYNWFSKDSITVKPCWIE